MMDPNEALRQVRQSAAEIENDLEELDGSSQIGNLLIHFQALDEWLQDGGFLPADWQQKSSDKKRAGVQSFCSSHDTQAACDAYVGGHYWLRKGDLAWFDSLLGPAKVKITRVDSRSKVVFEFTTDFGSYKKGNHEHASAIWVLPRDARTPKGWNGVPVWFEVTPDEET